jgi:hypothetical protein
MDEAECRLAEVEEVRPELLDPTGKLRLRRPSRRWEVFSFDQYRPSSAREAGY